MNAIPAKKAPTAAHEPLVSPQADTNAVMPSGSSSIKETYSMIPAEKPRATDKNLVLVRLVSNARALPTPVARPANNVKENANNTVEDSKLTTHPVKSGNNNIPEIFYP